VVAVAGGGVLGARPFGFASQHGYQTDTDTGLMRLGHRYYDASTGRFISRDPIQDGYNWYAYCDNDPVNAVDPVGLAKVYVVWKPVAGAGNHVFLLIVDENTGDSWTIGGGPAKSLPPKSLIPNLVDHSGPAGPGNYESIPKSGNLPSGYTSVLIKDDDRTGQWWFDKGNNIGGEIESKKLPYFFGNTLNGTNSNAFLYTVLKRAGLLDEWNASGHANDLSSNASTAFNGGAEYAPGWGTVIPR
jgi:RHS repeat-associated protein